MTRLAIFGGGSGCRAITIELVRLGLDVTRIVPAWDSGGSSRVIRERLKVLSIGDIRSALMALAHGEGRAGHVVKVFNTRLSDRAEGAALQAELAFYSQALHPALRAMEPEQRASIIGFLARFISEAGQEFDLRRGSLGNFVLAGAYLAHGRNINAAISVFRRLCSIRGNVWPVSTDNDLRLDAELRNGERVQGQHRITALDEARAQIGIRAVRLLREGGGLAHANAPVLQALADADAIVFGPGSFYTSVLPHLLVPGIAAATRARRVPKIFVGNMLECAETTGLSLNRMLEEFCRHGPLTHVLANQSPMPKYVKFHEGDALIREHALQVLSQDFEDPWQRGMHDPALVAATIARLSAG